MITDQILRSSGLIRLCYHQYIFRLNSTLSKGSSSNQNLSMSNKTIDGKSGGSEYLAADMYKYTPFSHYDIEVEMTKFRLPQPSSYATLKPPSVTPEKK